MKRSLALVAFAVLSITSVASAGNGIERTSLSDVDFTLGGELSEDLKKVTAEALEEKCRGAMAAADNVILINVDAKEDQVDQGILDMQYVLSFRVTQDSLPPRMIRVHATEFDVNTARPEARVRSVESVLCQ